MTQRGYDLLLQDLQRLEAIMDGWPTEYQATARAMRTTVEAITEGALRSLIRNVKQAPVGLEKLKEAVKDPWVYAVLDYHGLLRRPNSQPNRKTEQAAAEGGAQVVHQQGQSTATAARTDHPVQQTSPPRPAAPPPASPQTSTGTTVDKGRALHPHESALAMALALAPANETQNGAPTSEDAQAPLEARIEAALSRVRPELAKHKGDVELLGIANDQEVHIRLLGSCHGCAESGRTLNNLIKQEIVAAVPEVRRVVVADPGSKPVQLRTPDMSRPTVTPQTYTQGPQDFVDVADWETVTQQGVTSVDLTEASVLLAAVDGEPRAYINACPHLGLPLDHGDREGSLLSCRYHGFTFDLRSGECITAPEIQLQPYPVRVENGRVHIQVAR